MINNFRAKCFVAMIAGLLATSSFAQNRPDAGTAKQPADNSSKLQTKVNQLEEQLIDLRAMIGTVESLARQGGARQSGANVSASPDSRRANPSRGGEISNFNFDTSSRGNSVSSDLEDRVSGVETQIRALAGQIGQLSQQIQQLEARAPASSAGTGQGQFLEPRALPQRLDEDTLQLPQTGERRSDLQQADDGNKVEGFGSTVITESTPSNADSSHNEFRSQNPDLNERRRREVDVANIDPVNPSASYESAYNMLLERDYSGAEATFQQFLKKFPNDRLSGNAQYWLGETYYVRGKYREAADSFLKGYTKYNLSPKAPDSLLKLAMSLNKLKQKDAACATFAELNTKFPSAPPHVKQRAATEKRLLGC